MVFTPNRTSRLAIPGGLCAALLLGLLLALHWTSTPAAALAAEPASQDVCTGVTAIPESECSVLTELYRDTDGANWNTNTNWLVTAGGMTPCDWFGITCADGHVTEIRLSANRLSGSVPKAIATLPNLTHLFLDNNQLKGIIGQFICDLQDSIQQMDIGHNLAETRNRQAKRCLDALDPDWLSTQTIAPRNVTISGITSTTIDLNWTQIPYRGDGGHYAVGIATDSISGPYTIHGQSANKSDGDYTLDGLQPGQTYYIRIRTVTPAHDSQPDELISDPVQHLAVTRAPGKKILLAVYAPMDNNLAPHIPVIGERLRLGTLLNPNVQVVMLADGTDPDDTVVILMENGNVQKTTAVMDRWGINELDTADQEVLAWFLQMARTTYPADRMIVSMMGHGVGMMPEFAPVATGTAARKKLPPLPQGHDFTPGDITDNSYMSTPELGRALSQATQNGAQPFDLLFFDQCFQGSFDVLYEVRRSANFFIASPNYAWLIASYGKYLTQLAPARTTEEIAQAIIQLYQNGLNNKHPNSIFWINQESIQKFGDGLSNLADALLAALAAGEEARILAATEASQFVDTTQCGANRLSLGPPDELIGARSFGIELQKQFGSNDVYGINNALTDLASVLSNVQSVARTGSPWLAPGVEWNFTDSLAIVAPLARDTPSPVAWRASIYTETPSLQASWSVSPSATVVVSPPLASAVEQRWDNFIAAWYPHQSPTVGQWCLYIPPPLIADENTESFVLMAETTANAASTVQLNWPVIEEEQADGYWLFGKGPTDIQWNVLAVMPANGTYVEITLANGEHRLMLAVGDADGQFLAQSNEVRVQIGPQTIYLPWIFGEN